MDVMKKIRMLKKYSELRSDPSAAQRLTSLEDLLSGAKKIEAEVLWHNYAYRPKTY
jgi:hypothetical protein